MSRNNNQFSFAGGTANIRYHKVPHGKVEAILTFVNSAEGHFFTWGEILDQLSRLQQNHPNLQWRIQAQLDRLNANLPENMDRIYQRSCRGASREEAEKKARRELLPREEELAKLLFRAEWEASIRNGDMTLNRFYQHLGPEGILSGVTERTAKNLDSGLRNSILPLFGEVCIDRLSPALQTEYLKKLSRQLKKEKASSSKINYCVRAYKMLIHAVNQYGGGIPGDPEQAAILLRGIRTRNPQLLSSLRPDHLDVQERTAAFALWDARPEFGAELFWIGLLYAGFRIPEMAEATFGELKKIEFVGGYCYTCLVSRYMRKHEIKHTAISVRSNDFDFRYFRVLVLPPWVAHLLEQYIDLLYGAGYSNHALREMPLTTLPSGARLYPQDVEKRINEAIRKACLPDYQLYVTDADDRIVSRRYPVDAAILRQDAKYVAQQYCGMDLPALHATFGMGKTETDEASYLALYSDEYAVARYLMLRRFSPFDVCPSVKTDANGLQCFGGAYGCHRITVTNHTNTLCHRGQVEGGLTR